MSRRKKRLAKIRRNPKDVSFHELTQVLEDYGFTQERSSGSHYTFKVWVNGEWLVIVIPYARPVRVVYVKDAIKIIDSIIEQTESSEDEDAKDDADE